MKVTQLLETVSDTPASKADLDWSVSKIKDVKKAIDELGKKDVYIPAKQTAFKDKKNAERWVKILAEAQWRMDFAIKLHEEIIPEFNKIKAASNKAITAKDVDTLKKCHQEFKDLVVKYDLIKIERRVMHRDTTRLKVENGYARKISDAIQWILTVRDKTAKFVIQAGRSDEQNARAAKSSAAMKARWGSVD
jgi:hypothetical protein